MPDLQGTSSRFGALLSLARWLLIGAGAAMLVWCVLVILEARAAQLAARQSLELASLAGMVAPVRSAIGTSGGIAPPHMPVLDGAAVAALSIPRVRLSAVVLHGSDARTLRRGPGHLVNTALPGQPGNTVIAGHRDTFFRPLRYVEVGDDIFVESFGGRFHYRVTSLRVVNARDLSVLDPTDETMLTLITCYPFWVLGDAPDRFIVRAMRVAPQLEE